MTKNLNTDVVVIGSGPGGYTAAFRAADLGKNVILVERFASIGGVCLNVGCIPSKALLHIAKVVDEAHETSSQGVSFGQPTFEQSKLVAWKNSVIKKLTGGLSALAKQRKVQVIQGVAEFKDAHCLHVVGEDNQVTVPQKDLINEITFHIITHLYSLYLHENCPIMFGQDYCAI